MKPVGIPKKQKLSFHLSHTFCEHHSVFDWLSRNNRFCWFFNKKKSKKIPPPPPPKRKHCRHPTKKKHSPYIHIQLNSDVFFCFQLHKKIKNPLSKAPKILAFLASPFASSNASWKVLSWLSPDVRKLQRSTCVDMIHSIRVWYIYLHIYHILPLNDR